MTIIGYGNIGKRVGELARAIGMRVLPIRSSSTREELFKALESSDFVALHCPLTPETRHLLGAEAFARMKPGSVIVNCARGRVIDERALLDAIDRGTVSFVATDVLENEPPSADHPLLNHPRVFVTPHSTWYTEEAVTKLTDGAIDGLERYILTSNG